MDSIVANTARKLITLDGLGNIYVCKSCIVFVSFNFYQSPRGWIIILHETVTIFFMNVKPFFKTCTKTQPDSLHTYIISAPM
jgi:hypothetical protein